MAKPFLLCIFLLYIVLPTLVSAAIPKIEPYINDFEGVLTKDQIMQLNLLADSIEQNTTWEIAMVTVIDTQGLDRLDLANKIGDENGVGKKEKDNGIVVLWSEGEDRGLAIETGRYSESIFNDAKVGRIARAARPYFDNKSYYEGFLNITQELKMEIDEPTNSSSTGTDVTLDGSWILWVVFGGIIVFLVVRALADSDIGEDVGFNATSLGSLGRIGGGTCFGGGFSGGSFGGGGAKG